MNTNRDDQLRQRAYRIWEAEGRPEGMEAEHWARAERELAGEETDPASAATPAPAPRSRRKPPAAEPAATQIAGSGVKKPTPARKPAAPRNKKI